MAVLRNSYRPYAGTLTPEWSRFLIVARYAYREIFDSRLLTAFFVACFVAPVACALLIYLHYNTLAVMVLDLRPRDLVPINNEFFQVYLVIQGMLAFLLTAFVAPGLVSSDLADNALPLYLSRPFSRAEYVLGKISVLVFLLSWITWVPGLLLVWLQTSLEPGWLSAHLRVPFAIFIGSWIWILIISLLGLALSAWVRWKLVAGALLLGVFFVGAGLGQAINEIFETRWGYLINMGELIKTVWVDLFDLHLRARIPIPGAWAALLVICGACLFLLARKIRAYEVVRG